MTHFRPLLVFVSGWNWLSYCWGHAVRPLLIRVIRLQSLAEVQSLFLAFPDQLPSFGAGLQTEKFTLMLIYYQLIVNKLTTRSTALVKF